MPEDADDFLAPKKAVSGSRMMAEKERLFVRLSCLLEGSFAKAVDAGVGLPGRIRAGILEDDPWFPLSSTVTLVTTRVTLYRDGSQPEGSVWEQKFLPGCSPTLPDWLWDFSDTWGHFIGKYGQSMG